MSRLTLVEGLLQNLASQIEPSRREFLSREEARATLKTMTGQDFGYDVRRWREWFRTQLS
jgi:hypothetical protein